MNKMEELANTGLDLPLRQSNVITIEYKANVIHVDFLFLVVVVGLGLSLDQLLLLISNTKCMSCPKL
jgi:hypothetical protein